MRLPTSLFGAGISGGLNAFSGLGTGMRDMGGTFRLTNGTYNGSQISLRHYDSNWQGGSRARITTYSMKGWGRGIVRGTAGVSVVLGGVDIWQGIAADGNTFGTNAKKATGRTAGGLAGGWAGAKICGSIGACFGPWGLFSGAVIGGVVFGFLGAEATEELILYLDF
jgi:hypothetical protein